MANYKCINPDCKEFGRRTVKARKVIKMNGESHNISKVCEWCGSQLIPIDHAKA